MLRKTTPRLASLISYVTDVEGCYDFWSAFVSRSTLLCRSSSSAVVAAGGGGGDPSAQQHNADSVTFRPEFAADPDCHLVFGGDSFDKGAGDIRFAREILSLQRRFPGRVHLVLGNRDTNKLKLPSELNLEYRDRYVLPQPYYLNDQHFFSYDRFLDKQKAAGGHVAKNKPDHILLLKYILAHRMGSAELFEFRRHELALGFHPSLDASLDRPRRHTSEVSDDEVFESFLTMAGSKGIYPEMVRCGRLAVAVNDTVFAHGSINDETLGFVPDMSMQEVPYHAHGEVPPMINVFDSSKSTTNTTHGTSNNKKAAAAPSSTPNVREWFDALERFKAESLQEWEASGTRFDPATGRRGGASLFGYGHGRCIGPHTVEVSTFLQGGAPANAGLNTAMLLSFNGIHRIGVGHQPIGDTPLPIQDPCGISIVMADLSYGDKVHYHPPNGRGKAVSEVLIDCEAGTAIAHGCDAQGDEYCFDLDDPLCGKPVGDGWWAVGVERKDGGDDRRVLLRRTKDAFRGFEKKWASRAEVEKSVAGRRGLGTGRHFDLAYEPASLFPDAPAKSPTEVTRESPHKSRVKPSSAAN